MVVTARFPAEEYGLRTIAEGDDDYHRQMIDIFAVKLGLNLLSLLVILTSGYIRSSLLAPTTRGPDCSCMYVGHQCSINFGIVSWSRRCLWIVLGILSLPIHLLYNSLIVNIHTVHDAYEVLVNDDFLTGQSFDILSLSPTRFRDQDSAPIPFDNIYPSEWPAIDVLQDKLEKLQSNIGSWTPLSREDCLQQYAMTGYTSFRTVVIITNWTLPQENNSALGIGALPGHPVDEVTSRLLALCPAAWLNKTKDSFIPDTAAYILPHAICISGQTDYPGSGGCEFSPEEMYSEYDLCFAYQNNYVYNTSRVVNFERCLSEPIPNISARFVFLPDICLIVSIVIGIKALIASVAFFTIPGTPLFGRDPLYEDRYKIVQGLRRKVKFENPLHGKELKQNFTVPGTSRATKHIWIAVQVLLLAWMTVIYYRGLGAFGEGSIPSSTSDRQWYFGILLYPNIIQIILMVREYLESNWADGKAEGGGFLEHLHITLPLGLYNTLLHTLAGLWMFVSILDQQNLHSYYGGTSSTSPIAILDTAIGGFPKQLANDAYQFAAPFLLIGIVVGSILAVWPCYMILYPFCFCFVGVLYGLKKLGKLIATCYKRLTGRKIKTTTAQKAESLTRLEIDASTLQPFSAAFD